MLLTLSLVLLSLQMAAAGSEPGRNLANNTEKIADDCGADCSSVVLNPAFELCLQNATSGTDKLVLPTDSARYDIARQ